MSNIVTSFSNSVALSVIRVSNSQLTTLVSLRQSLAVQSMQMTMHAWNASKTGLKLTTRLVNRMVVLICRVVTAQNVWIMEVSFSIPFWRSARSTTASLQTLMGAYSAIKAYSRARKVVETLQLSNKPCARLVVMTATIPTNLVIAPRCQMDA